MKILNPLSSLACRIFSKTVSPAKAETHVDVETRDTQEPAQDQGPEKDAPDANGLQLQPENDAAATKNWDNPIEFLLSCISMSVGLGNVWRFPFTAYENGGGAFMIPYLVVLLLIGRPFYLLELGLGQFSSRGCVGVWDLAPAFRGVGYAQSFATFAVVSYYTVLIAISFRFLFSSFATTLPWTLCHTELAEAGKACLPSGHNISSLNITDNATVIASSEQYFRRSVLNENTDISEGVGLPDPALAGCLVLSWVVIFLTLRKGVSSSGKVAYFTAIFPYSVMLMLLIKGFTLPGALDGIMFLFTPDWSRLLEVKVWYAAVTQSFYSLSIGFGSLSTFSSFNKFRHNIYRDATIIAFADTFTSVLAGVITFSILGYLSHELDTPLEKVVTSGAGLAFISYPEVIAKFGFAPQFFAVIFFLMLITLGLGSAAGLINTTINTVKELVPALSGSKPAGLVSVIGLLVGLVYTTPGGQAVLELVDYYGGSLLILIVAVLEITVLAWVYGAKNLVDDLSFMLNTRLGIYWKFCWTVFIPVSLSFILGYTLVFYTPVKYAGEVLPVMAQVAGWVVTLAGVAMIVVVFVVSMARRERGWKPTSSWGPRNAVERLDWMNKDAGTSLSVIKSEIE